MSREPVVGVNRSCLEQCPSPLSWRIEGRVFRDGRFLSQEQRYRLGICWNPGEVARQRNFCLLYTSNTGERGEEYLFEQYRDGKVPGYRPVTEPAGKEVLLTGNLANDLIELRRQVDNSEDLIIRHAVVEGIPVAIIGYENMFSLQVLTQLVIRPLTSLQLENPSPKTPVSYTHLDVYKRQSQERRHCQHGHGKNG